MKCPNCGKEIANESQFCEFCGTKVGSSETDHTRGGFNSSKQNAIVIISVFLCLVFAGGMLYYNSETKKVREELRVSQEKAERESAIRLEAEKQAEIERSHAKEGREKLESAKRKAEAQRSRANVKAKAEENEFYKKSDEITGEKIQKSKQIPKGYVDLGLPSGTLWKVENETCGHVTYDQACSFYGSDLPTIEQLRELKDNCLWSWQGDGFKVKGKNGESIFMPAAGYCNRVGSILYVGRYGDYWSSTPNGSDEAWELDFGSSGVSIRSCTRHDGQSIRLVCNSD